MTIPYEIQRSTGARLSGGATTMPVAGVAVGLALATFWMEATSLSTAWIVFATMAAIVMARASFHPFDSFGAANTVTLARGGMTAFLAGLLLEPRTDGESWVAFGIAVAILALDGVDGTLARRNGTTSRFGARFDMEVDALLIMVLSAFVWIDGLAGAWVLALGLMRYVFVIAGWAVQWIAGDLPPSMRRKAICVVQIVALSALLVPGWTVPWSQMVAGASLALLTWSFAVDIAYLAKARTR